MSSSLSSVAIEKIKIGMIESYSQTITESDINSFAKISGDINPVHLDEEYAQKTRFKKRIVHGMHSASYFSALFGTKLPGKGCIYVSQTLSFKRPVYINDTVIAMIEVIKIDLEKNRVFFKTTCKVKNKIVTEGEAEIYVPKDKT